MSIRLITPPANEPVTLAEAKLHLRVDDNVQDTLISTLIMTAREVCEHRLNRAIMTQTWELVLDTFPDTDIKFAKLPVQEITSVKYIYNGTEVTMPSTDYELDNTADQEQYLLSTGNWPDVDAVANAVSIIFVCGFEEVPASIKSWILLAVGYMFERCNSGQEVTNLPHDFFAGLLDRYKVWSL